MRSIRRSTPNACCVHTRGALQFRRSVEDCSRRRINRDARPLGQYIDTDDRFTCRVVVASPGTSALPWFLTREIMQPGPIMRRVLLAEVVLGIAQQELAAEFRGR